ncbi:MAG: TolC family protein [Planctomycetota bacterium]|nr:TolC family protein [Planctomycetota bacterium]
MHRAPSRGGTVFTCLALACACAQVRPEPDFERARELVLESTGLRAGFDPAVGVADEGVLAEILADGLSLAEAESLALAQHRGLRAAFWDIGVAHADWVSSRLPENPALSLRLPLDGSSELLEGILAFELLDFWRIPTAAEGARAELDATVLRVARLAGEVLAETRSAYAAALAARARAEVAEEHLALAERLADAVADLAAAGSADALEVSLARGPALAAELDLSAARLAATDALRALARGLSLSAPAESLRLSDDPAAPAEPTLDLDAAVALAVERRLDLRALDKAVEAARARVEVEDASVLGTLGAGPVVERRRRGGHDAAAELEADLPLFDRNQAGIARARFELARLEQVRAGAVADVAREVRGTLERARTASRAAGLAAERLLPEAERALDLARVSHASGRASLFVVLDAQQRRLEARRRSIEAHAEAAAAVASLELALGSPLPAETLQAPSRRP